MNGVLGAPLRMHVWAQPRTLNPGDYNANTNPYLNLANVSLNVVSPQSTFTIDPAGIEVYNPVYSTSNPRFEHVHDSSTGLAGTKDPVILPAGMAAGIVGLQGFTFYPAAADGFGGVCDPNDAACAATPNSGDAWLFASFTITPTADAGSIELYLQVGLNGMSHVGESSSNMQVMFGLDTLGAEPAAYDPSLDKEVTLANDDPDAVLSLVKPGDYNGDGNVDANDYFVWRLAYGTTATAADGNSDGVVNAADYTVWRNHAAPTQNPTQNIVNAVPEPAAWRVFGVLAALLAGANRRRFARIGF